MLKKILPRAGINKENTRYTNEGGYYDCDKIRFRQGTPESIGGWRRISSFSFLGVCRSLWAWVTLASESCMAVATNLKVYVSRNALYYDITPIRSAATLSGIFTPTTGSSTILVTYVGHGCITGDFVTFYGATSLGGAITATVLNQEFQVTVITADSYTITASATATGSDAVGGGAGITAVYQINTGDSIVSPTSGWGAGGWGAGGWGVGTAGLSNMRLWSQRNFGQDLIFCVEGGAIYYWHASLGLTPAVATFNIALDTVSASITPYAYMPVVFLSSGVLPSPLVIGVTYYAYNVTGSTFQLVTAMGSTSPINLTTTGSGSHSVSIRAVPITAMSTDARTPTKTHSIFISDIYRFVFAFGTNEETPTGEFNPMLVRWSDQEDIRTWTSSATNQAGSIPLSHGSHIVTAVQNRQEIVVLTDESVYSLQYLGPPYVWGAQLMGDSISIASMHGAVLYAGTVYWIGFDKFYKYDGRVQPLNCDLRKYVFDDINLTQRDQIFVGLNEGFGEIWWFYCSAASTTIDRYVVYNHDEGIWYYGTMARTAWIDSGTLNYPTAATYSNNLVEHENGVDDNETETTQALSSYVTSSEFDIDDGQHFGYVWRVLPDISFVGSESLTPQVTLSIMPMKNSGSGYTTPGSVGGNSNASIARVASASVEQFTGHLHLRVRGRQMAFTITNSQIGTAWQLGSLRIDVKQDGTR